MTPGFVMWLNGVNFGLLIMVAIDSPSYWWLVLLWAATQWLNHAADKARTR